MEESFENSKEKRAKQSCMGGVRMGGRKLLTGLVATEAVVRSETAPLQATDPRVNLRCDQSEDCIK